jgi:hypothetical protein
VILRQHQFIVLDLQLGLVDPQFLDQMREFQRLGAVRVQGQAGLSLGDRVAIGARETLARRR